MPLTDDYGSLVWYSSKGATNNTTPQTAVSDPGTGAASYIVDENQLTVLNLDTAAVTIVVTITGGTPRVVERVSIAGSDKWMNSAKYGISAGETMTVELAASVATTQPTWSCIYYQRIN